MLCSCYTESVAWLCLDNFFEHFIGVTALVIAIWLSYADDMHQVTWYFNQYSSYMISILLCILISYIKKVSPYLPGQQPGSDEVTINISLQCLLTCLKGSVEVLFLLRNYFDQFSLLIHNHVDIQLKFLWFHSIPFSIYVVD